MSITIKFILLFFLHTQAFAQTIPIKNKHEELAVNFFLKKSLRKFDLIGKHKSADTFSGNYVSETSLGLRRRLHTNYQVGFHGGVVSGERRNDDWVKKETWAWKDEAGSFEPVLNLEWRARYALKNIKLEQATLTVDLELTRRFKSKQNSLKWGLSPAYFFMSDFIPKYTFLLNYYQYHSLNFARKSVYQKNYYISFLKQHNSSLSYGPSIGERVFIWTESPEFKERLQGSYRVKEKALLLAFSFQYTY
jgi:hypothetical protein